MEYRQRFRDSLNQAFSREEARKHTEQADKQALEAERISRIKAIQEEDTEILHGEELSALIGATVDVLRERGETDAYTNLAIPEIGKFNVALLKYHTKEEFRAKRLVVWDADKNQYYGTEKAYYPQVLEFCIVRDADTQPYGVTIKGKSQAIYEAGQKNYEAQRRDGGNFERTDTSVIPLDNLEAAAEVIRREIENEGIYHSNLFQRKPIG